MTTSLHTDICEAGHRFDTRDGFCETCAEYEMEMQGEAQLRGDDPFAPCGYCRRCAIHDDPAGCLTVEEYTMSHRDEALARIISAAANVTDEQTLDYMRNEYRRIRDAA